MSRFFVVLFLFSLTLGSCLDGELYTPGNEFVQEEDYPPVFIFEKDRVIVNYSEDYPFATISNSLVTASTLVVDKREEDGSGDYFSIKYPNQKWTVGSFNETDSIQMNYTINGEMYHNLDTIGTQLPTDVYITGIEEVIVAKDTLSIIHGKFSAILQTEDGLKTTVITGGIFRNIPIL